jgi:hypothetical protein
LEKENSSSKGRTVVQRRIYLVPFANYRTNVLRGGGGGWQDEAFLTDIQSAFQKNLLVNWERDFATSFQKYIVVDFVTEEESTLNRQ